MKEDKNRFILFYLKTYEPCSTGWAKSLPFINKHKFTLLMVLFTQSSNSPYLVALYGLELVPLFYRIGLKSTVLGRNEHVPRRVVRHAALADAFEPGEKKTIIRKS